MINIQIINTAATVQMRTLSVVTRLLCASTSFLNCAQLVREQKAGLCRKAILLYIYKPDWQIQIQSNQLISAESKQMFKRLATDNRQFDPSAAVAGR
jgi:hypothetical protein